MINKEKRKKIKNKYKMLSKLKENYSYSECCQNCYNFSDYSGYCRNFKEHGFRSNMRCDKFKENHQTIMQRNREFELKKELDIINLLSNKDKNPPKIGPKGIEKNIETNNDGLIKNQLNWFVPAGVQRNLNFLQQKNVFDYNFSFPEVNDDCELIREEIKIEDDKTYKKYSIIGDSVLKVEIKIERLTFKIKILEQLEYLDKKNYIIGNDFVDIYSVWRPNLAFQDKKLYLYIRGEESRCDEILSSYTFDNNEDLNKYVGNLICLILKLNKSRMIIGPSKNKPKCPNCNTKDIKNLFIVDNNHDFSVFDCNVCSCRFEVYK